MNELLQALTNADAICNQTQPHYEKATQLQQEAQAIPARFKKMKIKWTVIGLVVWEVVSMTLTSLGSIPLLGLVGMAAGCYLGIKGYQAEKAKADKKIDALQKQSEAEVQTAQEVFDDHAAEMDFLPVDYWYPMATSYLVKIVKNGRTNSLSEALDKFDDYLHRWKLEEANAQLVAQQQEQTAHLASIKRSSRISAAANVTNTVFNIASRL